MPKRKKPAKELKAKLNKQIALLKKCPVCKKGELQIAVDAVVYFAIDGEERIDDHLYDDRQLICTECGANSDDHPKLAQRFKQIDEVL